MPDFLLNEPVAKLLSTDRLLMARTASGKVVAPDAITDYVRSGISSAAKDTYPNSAQSNVPRGVVGTGSITGGTGGTTGTFALAFTGGNFAVNPTGTFTVSGGAVTSITFVTPGEYIGASPTAPTLSFAASAGLTGASATATVGFLIANGMRYWTRSADGLLLVQYQNLSGVATAVSPAITMATSEGVAAGSDASTAAAAAASASATLAGNNATAALLAYAQSEAAKYGITLGPDGGALWDLTYWRTDVFQDDGVTRATAAGHPVGLIKNRLGITSLDLIETDAGKKGTLQFFMGVPYVTGGVSTGLRFRGNQTLKIPHFMAFGLEMQGSSGNCHAGLVKSDGSQFFACSDFHTAKTSLLAVTPSRAWVQPKTEPFARPPKSRGVHHIFADVGWVDSRVNDDKPDPAYSPYATTWLDGDTVSAMSGGINTHYQSGVDPVYDASKGWAFFGGGCFLPGVKSFDRSALVSYFMDAMQPEMRSTDQHILFVTDSQNDDVDRDAGDFGAYPSKPGPIPLWILNHLAPANSTAPILYRKASWKGDFLTPWRADQVGSSDTRIFVSNLSVPGSQPNFFLGDKFEKMLGSFPHVDRVIIAHGGNMNHSITDAAGLMKVGEFKALTDEIWTRYPDADIRYLDPYPFAAALPDTVGAVRASCALAAGDYGLPVSNTYGEWFTAGRPNSRYFADNAHLSYGVGATFGIVVRAQDIQNLYAQAASGAKGQTSLGYATNGVTNGDLRNFEVSGIPTGATVAGPVTVGKSTKRADLAGGKVYGLRLQQTAGLGTISWTVDATPYRNKTVTAMACFTQSGRGAGAHSSEAGWKLSSNGTGAVDPNSWICESSGQGGGRKRFVPLSRPIAADATTITMTLTCANGGVGDVTLHFVSLAEGRSGKIPV